MIDEKETRVMRWKQGETPGPWRLFLFPTYRCNLKCGYCTQALVEDPPELLKEIPDERLRQLIDEAAEMGVREVIIGGGGEPMLRRKVVMEILQRARAYGMGGTLQTNGTAFRPDDLETLVSIGWPVLTISVDGPEAASNDAVRYAGSFDKLARNLERLKEVKAKHNATLPYVQLSAVVTAKNHHLLPDMIEFGHKMGVQRVHYLEVYEHHEGIEPFVLTPEHRKRVQADAKKATELAQKYGMHTNACDFEAPMAEGEPWKFPPPRSEEELSVELITQSSCFEPWLAVSIQSSGNVGPCCTFWEGRSDNIKDLSLRDVWMGPYMTELRERLLLNNPPEPCIECHQDLIQANREVAVAVTKLDAQFATQVRGPVQLVSKAVRSVQRHGVRQSFQRGREWLTIRRTLAHK